MNKVLFFALSVWALTAADVNAIKNLDFELAFTGANTGNLLSDSSNTEQTYSLNTATVSFYPLPMTKVHLKGEHTYYTEITNLSNYMLGGGVVFIPTGDGAPISVNLSADYETRRYRSDSLTFNSTDNWNAMVSLGHQVSPSTHLRAGLAFSVSDYTDSEVDAENKYEFIAGANFTIFTSASLDVEAGFSSGNYTYVDSAGYLGATPLPSRRINPGMEYADTVVTDGTLQSFYIAPRFSFSVGRRTGIALTLSHRSFVNPDEGACVYGFTSTFLSPWSTDYEGTAVTASIKTFLVPRLILSAGLGYFDKKYINTLETVQLDPNVPAPPGVGLPYGITHRKDEQTRMFVSAQLPRPSRTGPFIEPSVQIEVTNNTSSTPIYDYPNVAVSLALTIRF